jgi:hypothetical protein
MQIDSLLAYMELATGLATLMALALGIFQLIQVKRSMEVQTNLAVMAAERQVWQLALANPDTAPTLLKERWGDPAGERLFAALLLDHYEALYFQHRRGAITRAYWKGIERAMIEHISSPAIRCIWDSHKDLYWPDFAKLVDRRLTRAKA